jgi:chemotaxis protein MotB
MNELIMTMKPYIYVLLITVAVTIMGCSKMDLIAKKDNQIKDLRKEIQSLDMERIIQRNMIKEFRRDLDDFRKKHSVWMEQLGSLAKITLDGAAEFATARAELTEEAKRVVDDIWIILQQYPDRWILIEGHADNRSIAEDYKWKYRSNWELSSARANAVLHYLVERYDVRPDRVRAVGCGVYAPIADNLTPEGRAKNRRVEITVGIEMDFKK